MLYQGLSIMIRRITLVPRGKISEMPIILSRKGLQLKNITFIFPTALPRVMYFLDFFLTRAQRQNTFLTFHKVNL